jgi:large subunit ribosomal protein L25
MKTIEINGTIRSQISKQEIKNLRSNEQVPCVLYGGEQQIHFSVEAAQFKGLIYTPEVHMVKLNIDGTSYDATLQDTQFHPVNDAILHVDFLQVFENKPLNLSIPVRLSGASEGVKAGGKLVLKSRRLRVKAFPSVMPDFINVDITNLKIGGNIRVREINVEGVTFLDSPTNVIVTVRMTRNAAAEAAAAEKSK